MFSLKIRGKHAQADFIGNLLSTFPKPILFLFFILLMAGISALLSPVFNSFGVFCDSGGVVLSVPETNIITNIILINSLPDASEISGDILNPRSACILLIDGVERLNNQEGCSDCELLPVEDIPFSASLTYDSSKFCVGDAYKTSKDNLSWWDKKICPQDRCTIPDGYYFDGTIGAFRCIFNCDSQTMYNLRNKKLAELGAFPYYPESVNDNSYNGIFKFGCSDSLRVQPTIKGVAIFDLKIWAVLILIILLLWGLMRFKK